MRPAGIFRYVAADGARLLAGRVWGVLKALLLHRITDPQIHHAGLGHDIAIEQVDMDNLVEAAGPDHDRRFDRQAAPTEAGPGSARDKGDLFLVEKFNDRRHFFRRVRQDNNLRDGLLQGIAIAVVDRARALMCDHPIRTNDVIQAIKNFLIHVHSFLVPFDYAGRRRIMRLTVYSRRTVSA